MLNDEDVNSLSRANSHYSGLVKYLLKYEPIKGQCFFYSSPEQPFVIQLQFKLFNDEFKEVKKTFNEFIFDILGLKDEDSSGNTELLDDLMNTVLEIRKQARTNKDFATSDKIRDELKNIGIIIKDTKNGVEWSVEE